MISAITNQGKVRFQIYDGRMNADQLIQFMKRLIKDTKRKVFLILNNLRVHNAKKVTQWLAKHSENIEVFYLPAYSPELNPDEYLNCDLKHGIHSKRPARNQKQLKAKVLSHMRMLQKQPKRVIKFFVILKFLMQPDAGYLSAGLIYHFIILQLYHWPVATWL